MKKRQEDFRCTRRAVVALVASMGAALGAGFAVEPARAQAPGYPERPVTLVVPYAAGGPTDVLARLVAEGMKEKLKQSVLVDNKAGASGIIAYQNVKNASADGYTLAVVDIPFVINPSLNPTARYDAVRDFSPIVMIGHAPVALFVSQRSNISSVKDLIARAKSANNKLVYGSAGNGSPPHLFMEKFALQTGIKLTHVPYKGAAGALVDLAAGNIDAMFVGVSAARGLFANGSIKPLAVTSTTRMQALPSVPTMKELGYPDEDLSFGPWWGITGPAGLAPEIVEKINAAVRSAVSTPAVQKNLHDLDITADVGTPQDLSAFLARDAKRWKQVIESAGIKNE